MSKKIKIVSFKICPFVQRVTALLEAKQIPYDLEYIKLSDKPQWFLDISPTGQVPVLITENDQALFESDAIIEYIDETTAALQPKLTAEQKALNRAWSYQASKHYLAQCSTMRSVDKATLDQRLGNLAKSFAKAEQALASRISQGRYFNGDGLSNVDIAWLPLLHRADIIRRHRCFDMLDGFPRVQQWQQALLATGLAEKSVADDFEAAFTDFYLSDQTYLGKGEDCTDPESPCGSTQDSSTCC